MPFKRFDTKRGHYELMTWGQVGLIVAAVVLAIALAVLYLLTRPVSLTPEQQAVLQNINCLRGAAGNTVLTPDRRLMDQAQDLAALFQETDEWLVVQQIAEAGAEVQWAIPDTDLSVHDPCMWRWFVPFDVSSPVLAVISDPAISRIGIGYTQVERPTAPGATPFVEEVIVYIVR